MGYRGELKDGKKWFFFRFRESQGRGNPSWFSTSSGCESMGTKAEIKQLRKRPNSLCGSTTETLRANLAFTGFLTVDVIVTSSREEENKGPTREINVKKNRNSRDVNTCEHKTSLKHFTFNDLRFAPLWTGNNSALCLDSSRDGIFIRLNVVR